MIRLSANLSRKIPIANVDYSSQQYGASMEVEASDTDSPEAIKQKFRQLYAVLEESVNAQIAAATEAHGQAADQDNGDNGHRQSGAGQQVCRPNDGDPRSRAQGSPSGNGNGQRSSRLGQPVPATAAQIRAIKSIALEQGLDLAEVLAPYRVTEVAGLSIRNASKLIDDLKSKKANGNRR